MTLETPAIDDSAERGHTVLYEGENVRVCRVQRAGGAGHVIFKERRGENAVARVCHERRILERLAGVAGVPHLVQINVPANTLVMEDYNCLPLTDAIEATSPTEDLAAFAQQLAQILVAVHRAGVIHKDINPSNILVTGARREPHLIDFDLATTFAEERPAFVHHREIAGTLAYLAPEQTGRMGRSVDQRADLYALGATLYELACGRPPFRDNDPLQLIHDILARVPAPPIELNPAIAPALSAIVMRLLEKEPDRRYQSADGLLFDLTRLRGRLARKRDGSLFALGANDFPPRLAPPSQLIGRTAEIAALRAAFERAISSPLRGLLIAGAPGVGKTALINELRPQVTARRGWFVSAKFDQYRQAAATAPATQVMFALSHLLMAEAEADFAAQRERLLHALGDNAGLIAATDPQMAALLQVAPEIASGDPLAIDGRKRRAAMDILRTVAGPERPVVIVLDNLQWADTITLDFIDAVLTDTDLRGLLLVGAYREIEFDAAHPLHAMLARWRKLAVAPAPLQLRNLPPADLHALLKEMLRLQPADAEQLATVIATHTAGNPYDTVELINALRQDGILTPTQKGWQWDTAAIRRYAGRGTVLDLLAARIARLPGPAQAVLEVIACLGGNAQVALLAAANGCSEQAVEEQLLPSQEDGLLVLERDQVGFQHDRVQQAVYSRLDAARRSELQLTLARRLAALPRFESQAAELYLPVVEAVQSAPERRRVVDLFQSAATKAHTLLLYATAERYLAAATTLMDVPGTAVDEHQCQALEKLRHTVLYSLGRLDEADAVYRAIESRNGTPLSLAEVACVQVSSLTARGHTVEAVALGLDMLARLGFETATGSATLEQEIAHRLQGFYRWLEGLDNNDETQRPECDDARVLAAARLIDRAIPAAYFSDVRIMAWLILEAYRLWAEYGPCAPLLGPVSHAAFATVELREDYRSGYRAVRHVLAVASARRYTRAVPRALFVYALSSCHWFEPLQECVSLAQRAYEALLRGGDVQSACFTFSVSVPLLLEYAPTLDTCDAEIDAALAIAEHTGNSYAAVFFEAFRQVVHRLTTRTNGADNLESGGCDQDVPRKVSRSNPTAVTGRYLSQALLGTIFGDVPMLVENTAAVMRLLPHIKSTFGTMPAHLMRALALTQLIRTAAGDESEKIHAEFKVCRSWLARRAEDAPKNFLHLLHWIDAEYAAAQDNFQQAAVAFDRALEGEGEHLQGWRRPLITERAGLFYQANGAKHLGRVLLNRARHYYEQWGATAKVLQLERTHRLSCAAAVTEPRTAKRHSSGLIAPEAIDMVAILRASQMLSSETSLERLKAKVVELLGSLTGATRVLLILPDDNTGAWMLLPSQTGKANARPITVEQAGKWGLLPLSAFRYALRKNQPLLVEDATRDDRFARDPYLAGLEYCSLMVVPILSQGSPRAMLLLENRLSRGVFLSSLLDTVALIAGQLAVSLDNARLYASLEEKVAERTAELKIANRRLEELSITDALTGLANRRRFTEVMEAEWLRAQRTGSPIGIAMIDVDQFKLYNDHYGHQQGDACLRQVGKTLRRIPRDGTDLVARYGGEEFVVVLPNTDLAGTRVVAERLRAAVAKLRLPHEPAPRGIITISVGIVALAPGENVKAADLIEGADKALYLAKQNGRNRVEAGHSFLRSL